MGHYIPKIVYGDSDTEIAFAYPPADDDGDQMVSKAHVSESISGVRQVSLDYMEVVRDLKFRFLSEALKSSLSTFFQNHGGLGKTFKYYEDQSLLTFAYYELSQLNFKPKKITSVGANAYIWELPLSMRRVLGLSDSGDTTVFTIANNQVAAANVTGLLFDKTAYTSAIITAELRRTTATQELVANVKITAQYESILDTWRIATEQDGDECEVTFSITSAGQVQYTSSNLTGGSYVGLLKAKQSTFGA